MKKKLNPNAQKWVAALRSGEYHQGEGLLNAFGKFCCLGVACDVFLKESGNEDLLPIIVKKSSIVNYGGNNASTPSIVMDWIGISSPHGHMDNGDSLTRFNDTYRKTFAEIADIIESQPEGLFK